jgi:O-antigen/teichoic acid export membrane protein
MICLEKYKLVALQRILFDTILFCAIILPLLFGTGFDGLIYALLVSAPLNFIFGLGLILREIKIKAYKFDASLIKTQMNYSLPIAFTSVILVLMTELDKVMVSYFFPPAIFAVYAIGARELPFINNLLLSISGVIQPKLVDHYHQEDLDSFVFLCHRAARKTALVIFPIFVFSFIAADHIITILFTNKYIESATFFRVYLLILPMRFISPGPILLAMGFPKKVMISSAISLVFNLIVTVLLIETIGIIGACISILLSNYLNFSYLLFHIRRKLNTVTTTLFPWSQLFKILLMSSLIGVCLYPLIKFFQPSLIILLSISIIYFGIYLLVGLFFKIIHRAEMVQIMNLLRIGK